MKNVMRNGTVERVKNEAVLPTDTFVPKKYSPLDSSGNPETVEGKRVYLPTLGKTREFLQSVMLGGSRG